MCGLSTTDPRLRDGLLHALASGQPAADALAAAGNLLADSTVPAAMLAKFNERTGGNLGDRLIAALVAAAKAINGTDLSWIVGLVITVPLYYLLAVRLVARLKAPR